MKKLYFISTITFFLGSCVPPGKLAEAFDANTQLVTKYDSLYQSHQHTVAMVTKSLGKLSDTVHLLNDSVNFYREMANKPPIVTLTKGDILFNKIVNSGLINESDLNQITFANENSTSNTNKWIEDLKATVKTITGSNSDLKMDKGFMHIDVSTKLLFNSGKTTLSPKAHLTLLQIAKLLNNNPTIEVMIEGHTDNISFKSNSKKDNWDLSVERATTVVRILQSKYKVNPKRIIAAGRSEFMPIDNNKTAAGRANNRYIRIVLMPTLGQVLKN